MNIEGIKKADTLATEVTGKQHKDPAAITSINYLKNQIKNKIGTEWDELWERSEKGRNNSGKPKYTLQTELETVNRMITPTVIQMRTGH